MCEARQLCIEMKCVRGVDCIPVGLALSWLASQADDRQAQSDSSCASTIQFSVFLRAAAATQQQQQHNQHLRLAFLSATVSQPHVLALGRLAALRVVWLCQVARMHW